MQNPCFMFFLHFLKLVKVLSSSVPGCICDADSPKETPNLLLYQLFHPLNKTQLIQIYTLYLLRIASLSQLDLPLQLSGISVGLIPDALSRPHLSEMCYIVMP
jgi:hypothetical protein